MALISISRTPRAATPGGPLDALRECHGRIRDFCAVAARLADAEAAPGEISEAASAVLRYFGEALPLHEADEERDLVPALEAHAPGPEVAAALGALAGEHLQIGALLASLAPLWREVADAPERLPQRRERLGALTRELGAAFLRHLEMEERLILPAAERLLTPAEQEALRASMRDRRATPR